VTSRAGDGPASLELEGITKSFGASHALDGAAIRIHRGEIHALLGENGAGKSTLVSIASGRLPPDSGSVVVNGEPVSFRTPREARRRGIALVAQHDLLAEAATVADNLALLDPGAPFFESPAARRSRVERLSRTLGLELGEPDSLVAHLPVGTRQRIEIAGALSGDPAILILDEPTAVLSPDERAALFVALRQLARTGRSVLLITHRLAEVFEAADRLTILARGKTVLECLVDDTTPEAVATLLVSGAGLLMCGTGVSGGNPRGGRISPPAGGQSDSHALNVRELLPRGLPASVSLTVRAGELVTLLAIDGNGADRIASAIAGVHPSSGTVSIDGRVVRTGSPQAFRAAGGAFVPADRRAEGIVPSMTLAENIALADRRGSFLLRPRALAREAGRRIARFGIRTSGPTVHASELSGGNQQKLILARELEPLPRVLVAIHPVRGLDIASASDVHRRIASALEKGTGVVLVTTDPDEARSLGGTIRVVYRGSLSSPLSPETDPVLLGRRMAGLAA
jgi:general nucleoside transport system ATP-binding protein